jgi:hypothetical protein
VASNLRFTIVYTLNRVEYNLLYWKPSRRAWIDSDPTSGNIVPRYPAGEPLRGVGVVASWRLEGPPYGCEELPEGPLSSPGWADMERACMVWSNLERLPGRACGYRAGNERAAESGTAPGSRVLRAAKVRMSAISSASSRLPACPPASAVRSTTGLGQLCAA